MKHLVAKTSEFDPEADTPEERAQVEAACQHFYHNRFKAKPCADLLWCFQVLRENNFKQTIPSVTIEDGEEITYQKVTSAIRRGAHHLATLQTTDGHWPAQIVGPLFFLPPLGYNIVMTTSLSSHVLVGYFSWAVVTVAFISNCDARNMRLQALEALEKSNIKIDSYGGCHRNCDGGPFSISHDYLCGLNDTIMFYPQSRFIDKLFTCIYVTEHSLKYLSWQIGKSPWRPSHTPLKLDKAFNDRAFTQTINALNGMGREHEGRTCVEGIRDRLLSPLAPHMKKLNVIVLPYPSTPLSLIYPTNE
ncbi:hypothetical protein JHK87_049753 [Glycine soja]|nr:hypothetical protein JHK87_049753 [Glycine soja]